MLEIAVGSRDADITRQASGARLNSAQPIQAQSETAARGFVDQNNRSFVRRPLESRFFPATDAGNADRADPANGEM
jgi:hypothetical protein